MNTLPRHRHTAAIAQQIELPGRRVLDIGCGDGTLVGWLARQGAQAFGADPGPAALAAARRNVPDGRFVAAGAERLPFADGCFDAVVCVNALHHVPVALQGAALAEAARVAKRGGLVIVIEPLAQGPNFQLVQPIDDETGVRDAAYGAIKAAARTVLRQVREDVYDSPARYPDFAAFERRMMTVDPSRRPAFERLRTDLAARFARLGVVEDGEYVFAQPARLNLLARD